MIQKFLIIKSICWSYSVLLRSSRSFISFFFPRLCSFFIFLLHLCLFSFFPVIRSIFLLCFICLKIRVFQELSSVAWIIPHWLLISSCNLCECVSVIMCAILNLLLLFCFSFHLFLFGTSLLYTLKVVNRI